MEPENIEPIVTEEIAAKYKGKGKGRIPKAIVKQVVEINGRERKEKMKEAIKQRKIAAQLRVTKRGIAQREKIDLFLEEYLKNGGNGTEAAMTVFNCSNRSSASVMGATYLAKARKIGQLYLEKQGYGYGKLLDIATQKMLESKTPEWWDRIMKIAEYHDFMTKEKPAAAINVNVMQAHKSLASEYVDAEVIEGEESTNEEESEDESE